jgi:phosphohistidine phosphatase SixA
MFDLDFTEKVTAALASSFVRAQQTANVAIFPCPEQQEQLQRICRHAARQLLFDLDGHALLDLALKKLSNEHQLKAAGLSKPYLIFAASV